MTFITDDIVAENGLTATTFYSTNLNVGVVSAATFYGNSNLIINDINLNAPNNSILFNQNLTIITGSTNFTYDGNTLFLTGTTRFTGSFFRTNSPSAKIQYRWDASRTIGATPGIIWTNMPASVTTWLATDAIVTGDATYITDLTEYTEARFSFSRQAAGSVNSVLTVQNSLNNSTWFNLVTLAVGTGTGERDSNWFSIPTSARTFNYIRLVGSGGNGTADPRFSPPTISFR